MKILLYNWVNYDDEEGRGGGVRFYQENLIAELIKEPTNRVYTLSSGVRYDLFDYRIYIRERPRKHGVASYEVINSPVAAPANSVFYALEVYLRDNRLQTVIQDFLETHGPFDVIQFDNLEGLTAGVLELKRQFPRTRFIYYMHNYNLICPQVNLWFAESMTCDDYNQGKRCAACLPYAINLREVKIAHAISDFLKSIGIKRDSFVFRSVYNHLAFAKRVLRLLRRMVGTIRPERTPAPVCPSLAAAPARSIRAIYTSSLRGQLYREYRKKNVNSVNRCFDHVLVVSQRVGEIAVRCGVAQERISVVYIGSRFAEHKRPIRVLEHDHLKIAYLGYERKDKGFYHFVEALEAMPRSAARRISVMVAARLHTPGMLERLRHATVEFLDFELVDGYEHSTLPHLLEDVDLGVVPVLWEDNLPQVAIEFVAHGVPVLSSDLGGAKELCGANRRFIYRHGNVNDFIDRIQFFLDHRSALASYAERGVGLTDMSEHLRIMAEGCYRASAEAPSALPVSAGYEVESVIS